MFIIILDVAFLKQSKQKFHYPRTLQEKRVNIVPCLPGASRETGEGWPLLTVETEVNGDSKSTNERGPFLVGSFGFSCWYKRFLFCLGCSSLPSTKYFFPHHTLFQLHYKKDPKTAPCQDFVGQPKSCLYVIIDQLVFFMDRFCQSYTVNKNYNVSCGQWWAKLLRLLTVNSLSYFVKIKY